MRKGWGTHGAFTGVLTGTLVQIVENGDWLGFTVDDGGARKTVMLSRTDAPSVFITEAGITITEAQPNA